MQWKKNIAEIFSAQIHLDEEIIDALISKWNTAKTLKRNDFLAQPGQIESNLFYVIKGSMRIYFPQGDDEICVGFAYDNNLICSYPSFIQQKPSEYFIQALAGTELMAISRKEFYGLLDQYSKLDRCWRLLEEQALLGKIEREVEMLTFTPEQRYSRLLERSPHIFQIIPKKYIASYLRMSPETLSRLRPA
jgi:CRP-like cAMP-binding protein